MNTRKAIAHSLAMEGILVVELEGGLLKDLPNLDEMACVDDPGWVVWDWDACEGCSEMERNICPMLEVKHPDCEYLRKLAGRP